MIIVRTHIKFGESFWPAYTVVLNDCNGLSMAVDGKMIEKHRMTAVGYKQTFSRPKSTSAVPPKADIPTTLADFRL